MSWQLVWSGSARHDMRHLDSVMAKRLVDALDRLAETGQGDVRPLTGRERQGRLRVGDDRVLFTFDHDAQAIAIIRVLPRGRAYRG